MTSVYRPGRKDFLDLLSRHTVVPVWREIVADSQTPVAAFTRLDPGPDGFLLESVEGGERWGRYSFIGGDSFAGLRAKDGAVTIDGDPPVRPEDGEPALSYVKRLIEACRSPQLAGLPPLHGGAVGYLGYDCVREIERLGSPPEDDLKLPDIALLLTRTFVVFDHLLQKAYVITNVAAGRDRAGAYDDAVQRCEEAIEKLSRPAAIPAVSVAEVPAPDFSGSVDDAEFGRWVDEAKEHILAGEIFQVVPSRRFELDLRAEVFAAYRVLRMLNPSPYMYFLRFGELGDFPALDVAGSSPEPLVRVTGDHVVTRPIAGTRPRGADEDEDRELERDLLSDEKEKAEHIMLVDLARNDVGRVAEYGSVTVDELMVVERYSHVMHIVSNVSGRLRPELTPFDALTACFPAGTVSGAPKVRAMEIIDSLEVTRRGPYAGVVGYFDFSGNLDTCITIRTIVAVNGKAYVQAGAGVVADSVPANEAEETRRKAEVLLRAVAASELLTPEKGG
ncbi:MAG: anthranilate synthase component I [Actinomycetota bacterium]|nr:anthranilate synthase component I [Actinomycetota bacterium]